MYRNYNGGGDAVCFLFKYSQLMITRRATGTKTSQNSQTRKNRPTPFILKILDSFGKSNIK